jgi:hypothetical protein
MIDRDTYSQEVQRAEQFDELFSDGWRAPYNDTERLAVYIVFVAGCIGSIAAIGFCSSHLIKPLSTEDRNYMPPALCWVAIVLSALMLVCTAFFFNKERKHWNLKQLTLERVFAGIFCFWIALGCIGRWIIVEGSIYGAVLFPIALAGLILTMLVALPIAYSDKLFPKKQVFEQAFVLRRFAVDDKGEEHDDYVAPFDFGMKGYVTLRQMNVGTITLPTTYGTYDLADPRTMIYAKAVNGTLTECHILRR